MNRIHSSVLALVMCIFLIQATDPPFEKPTGSFVNFFQLKMPALIFTPFMTSSVDDKKTISDRQFLSTELQPPTLGPLELHPPTVDPQELHPPVQDTFNYQPPSIGVYSTLQDPLGLFNQDNGGTQQNEQNNFNANLNLPVYPPIQAAPSDQSNTANNNNEAIGEVSNYSNDFMQITDSSNNTNNLYNPPNNNQEFHNNVKTDYTELTEQEFLKPLLKLYENVIHQEDNVATKNTSHISKNFVETVTEQASQNEVVAPTDKIVTKNKDLTENRSQKTSLMKAIHDLFKNSIRRDDMGIIDNKHKEHIGEILPTDFRRTISTRFLPHRLLNQLSFKRKSEREHPITSLERAGFKIPVIFPSNEGVTENVNELHSVRSSRLGFLDQFRIPRRYNKFRDTFYEGHQSYFDPSARYQTAWSSRRPRVIFPTDQVAFRDPVQNQEQEPEWLAGDNTLQDLQEQDVRDRGKE